MTFAENLHRLRILRGMSMAELADAVGTSRQTIHRYESGRITNVPYDRVEALASALDVRPSELLSWQTEEAPRREHRFPMPHGKLATGEGLPPMYERLDSVPMLGDISCGLPRYAEQTYTDEFAASTGIQADFCLRAQGDSMVNARIHHGDLVFVRRQESVDNGSIAAVLIDDETTLKRVYYNREANQLVLMPENPAFSPMIFEGEELSRIRILGLAVGFQSILH